MKTQFKNQKLEFCKDELRVLIEKLISGNYKTTADFVFDHIAHTGVDTDLQPELKKEPTIDEFLNNE
ncbi:MAG: hypothetical protein A3J46_03635 [Candidatus Yanofskybacteria bacterium RIFCSPHIGHO2_02_FULL_41_11]|uniref:Uncharacterized protein n=1 Tax=Candidatus Yanofskybacteria bacterium RIFCSPHIGHO2_02_FULL_41_11 TaxID=1802675 RepID=A0A1F8F9A0_9BACT|nr:MAG: hypothetical protein A3J46_03635 [Candidatus Yanofskybacteria bacterium RIFCSPHIGHO2_02_FULL_41_11]